LPRIEESCVIANQPESENGSSQGVLMGAHSGTILVVEDESGVRELTRSTLRNHGYLVLAAASVAEALDVSKRYLGPIHLVLTDVVMPGGGGRELAEKLAVGRPDTRILYMSGYADQSVLDHGLLDASAAFLQKPFTASTLMSKVRTMLDMHQNLRA
jgi:DNA-binding NtrC family response regulator